MKRLSASDTSAVWNAVGQQPYDVAVQRMIAEGWQTVDINTTAGEIVLVRNNSLATLYLQEDDVGMVAVYTYITAAPEPAVLVDAPAAAAEARPEA